MKQTTFIKINVISMYIHTYEWKNKYEVITYEKHWCGKRVV